MTFPVDHVLAGNVGEGIPFVFVDVVKVVTAFMEACRIGIARKRTTRSGVRQVIGQPGFRRIRGHRWGVECDRWRCRILGGA